MTNSVGIVGTAPGAQLKSPSESAVSTPGTSDQASFASSLTSRDPNAPISPRIIVDPLAGVITQFLGTNGELQSQIPSAAVVAYLRAGLTPEGFAKPTPGSEEQSKDNGAGATGKSILA
jgi:hypothetical protein